MDTESTLSFTVWVAVRIIKLSPFFHLKIYDILVVQHEDFRGSLWLAVAYVSAMVGGRLHLCRGAALHCRAVHGGAQ